MNSICSWVIASAASAAFAVGCSSNGEPGDVGAGRSGAPAIAGSGSGSGGTPPGGGAGLAAGSSGGPGSGGGALGGSGGTGAPTGGATAAGAGAGGGAGGSTEGGSSGQTGAGGAAPVSGGQAGDPATGGRSGSGGSTDAGGGSAGKAGGGGAVGLAGAAGAPAKPQFPFFLGADISSVQESNTMYRDVDGQTKSIFELLKAHGFNYIRLKTFVDPSAPYGYASTENGCAGLREPFGDRDHVIAFGKQAKAAGMGFLLDFHYSDVWADPGNQIIPEKWRGATTIVELAELVKSYTKDVLTTARAAGALPDMVQVGNEITPGMLMHVPGPNTDCWGNNPAPAPIGGSTSNWNNLATLLKAGIEAVREVDPTIQVMLHVENSDDLTGVRRWVDNARSRDVKFDVLGLSCYTAFQGQPSVWENTFRSLASTYPDLKFVIAEYNPERTRANLIMKGLPDGRGLGTFFWEPTRSGEWGESMFTFQGGVATAKAADFAEYDELRSQLGL